MSESDEENLLLAKRCIELKEYLTKSVSTVDKLSQTVRFFFFLANICIIFVFLIVHRFKVTCLLSDCQSFEDHHGDSSPRFLFEEIKNKIEFIQTVLTSVKTQVI